jgi:hypothetical protein
LKNLHFRLPGINHNVCRLQSFRCSGKRYRPFLPIRLNDRQCKSIQCSMFIAFERFMTYWISAINACNKSLASYLKLNEIVCIGHHHSIFIDNSCSDKREIISIAIDSISICFQNDLCRSSCRFYFLSQNYFSISHVNHQRFYFSCPAIFHSRIIQLHRHCYNNKLHQPYHPASSSNADKYAKRAYS